MKHRPDIPQQSFEYSVAGYATNWMLQLALDVEFLGTWTTQRNQELTDSRH
jgi:hypothetical protein